MLKWQNTVRVLVALIAVGCAILVAVSFRKRTPKVIHVPLTQTDPKAVLENSGGVFFRLNRDKEEVQGEYERLLTYPNGSSKMLGVRVTTLRNGRTFVITGNEGQVGDRDSSIELAGNVHVTTDDGLQLRTERATYAAAEGITHAPGPAQFSRGRMNGSGVGLDYDKNQDILTVFEAAVVHVAPDDSGTGGMDVTSGAFEFRRPERTLRFDRSMKAVRQRETIEADMAVAHLTADEEHLEAVELRGQSRITVSNAAPGGLQALNGRDIDLKYGPDGIAIQHAMVNGEAVMRLAGEDKQPGRQISATTLDVSIAPDGTTPTALTAREHVRVSLPAEEHGVSRTIAAQSLESSGDEKRGLTVAHFAEDVQFAERGDKLNRTARSGVLDASLGPGFGSIEEARFAHAVRFVDGAMTATAAAARYVLAQGTLELSGREPGSLTPHIVNDQIAVDAARLNVTLEGPVVKAAGAVKSILQPAKPEKSEQNGKSEATEERPAVRVPGMLKQDQPVNVTAEALDYDGVSSRAAYTGNALLWQGETSIKGSALTIDSQKGDMTAAGPVATVGIFLQDEKDGKRERVRSRGAAQQFAYDDAARRATYTGEAHVNGPEGDLTAARVELFISESGDELERIEGYDDVKLKTDTQTTTGRRLTYFGEEGRYLMDGAPVKVLDACGRETTGRTLTFFRTVDRIIIDGQIRAQTKGKSNCPGS